MINESMLAYQYEENDIEKFKNSDNGNLEMRFQINTDEEERQLVLKSMLSTSMLKYENFDKIESSTMTLVYSFYPYRRKLVFDKR